MPRGPGIGGVLGTGDIRLNICCTLLGKVWPLLAALVAAEGGGGGGGGGGVAPRGGGGGGGGSAWLGE